MMRRFLLAVFSLLLVCGLVEAVLRVTHLFNARISWTEPDRRIAWRFTPKRAYWFFAENDHAITGRINGAGWRDRERAQAKPPGMRRVAVLGDSYVEAFQVEMDSTFAAVAEHALDTRSGGDTYEVMNFGRSGMSPGEELIVLERDILPRQPDTVMLLFTPHNDIADVNPVTAADPCRPFFKRTVGDSLVLDLSFVERRDFRMRERLNPFKQHSALISLVSERYNAARLTRAQRRVAPAGALTREQRMCTSRPDSVFVANYELCKLLIVHMARRCEARGIRFVLAAVPLVYQEDAIRTLREADATFEPDFFDLDLAKLADVNAFRFVPMSAAFRVHGGGGGKALHWTHWNYAGHDLVALLVGPTIGGRPAPAKND